MVFFFFGPLSWKVLIGFLCNCPTSIFSHSALIPPPDKSVSLLFLCVCVSYLLFVEDWKVISFLRGLKTIQFYFS